MQLNLPQTKTKRWLLFVVCLLPMIGNAQNAADSTLQSATLDRVVQYALVHQPAVRQAKIDQEITNKAIKGKLADWYPQVSFNYLYNRFFDLQKSIIAGNAVRFGVFNTSTVQLSATQNVFNRDVLLASSSASTVRLQAEQNIGKSKIDVVVNVTKAFYDFLATAQQIKVTQESIVRLRRSVKDALSRYNAGLTDKTDYKRATIQLGNAEALLKANEETLKYKEENLKTLIGYPAGAEITLQYDTLQMEKEISLDTMQQFDYAGNIDYKLLSTQRELQQANVKYAYWAYLPTLSLAGFYNLNYFNNNFNELYNTKYPYSYVTATVSLPIFQGGKRIAKIKEQKWTRTRIDVGLDNLESALNTEYTRALAAYKSNLANYQTQKENVDLAQEVYDVIQLQYINGVKTYLDVTIAESDLRTTRINYYNALYQVLASKMDVLRASGQINY